LGRGEGDDDDQVDKADEITLGDAIDAGADAHADSVGVGKADGVENMFEEQGVFHAVAAAAPLVGDNFGEESLGIKINVVVG